MRKDFGAKPWIYPELVLIVAAYDENGKPNAMNAAWGGIADDTQVSVCLSPEHKTVKNILASKAFTLSIGDAKNLVACDYVGIASGNDTPDKMEKTGWHFCKAANVNAPLIEELPFTLECRLISYDEKTCRCWGEIINLSVDEKILTADGKIDMQKFEPLIYDPCNHFYYKFGEIAGKAFSDGLKLK